MSLFAEIVISAAVCLAIFLPLRAVRRKITASLPESDGVVTELVIHASGEAESLEYVAAAAEREMQNAPFISRITVKCRGLSPDARAVAEILRAENGNIFIETED